MTRFCPHCGHPVAATARFCGSCGGPASLDARPTPGQVPPGPWQPTPSGTPLGPRASTSRMVVLGVVALAVVAVAAIGATALLGGGGGGSSGPDGASLPAPISSEPHKSWDYTFSSVEGYGTQMFEVDDDMVLGVLGDDGLDITRLSAEGEERWSGSVAASYLQSVSPGGDVGIATEEDGGSVTAFSLADGDEAWVSEDWSPATAMADGLLVVEYAFDDSDGPTEIGMLDYADGNERWRTEVDSWATWRDGVYALADGELSRLDAGTGEPRWSVSIPATGDDEYVSIAPADDLVVVASETFVKAFDPDGGGDLWSESAGDFGAFASTASVSMVQVDYAGDPDDEYDVGESRVFSAEGEVGFLPEGDGTSLAVGGFVSDGAEYVLDNGNNAIYDAELKPVAKFPEGTVTPVEGGVYFSDGSDVGFYPLGETSPVWTLRIGSGGGDSYPGIDVGDGFLVVNDLDTGKITRYDG